MIVTKEEAKKLWCPMVRKPLGAGFGCTNGNIDWKGNLVSCIADDCMMWAWKMYENGAISIIEGYCGLVNYHISP